MKHKNSKQKDSAGFTLIELLVVISIIGLLASVVLVALNGARTKARNAKRVAEIKQVVTAFSLGLNGGASLPDSSAVWACISATCYGGWSTLVPNASVDAFLAPYLAQKPVDPIGSATSGGYAYYSNWPGGTSPYDGGVFVLGSYVTYSIELPVTTGSCGSGRIWQVISNQIQCMQIIN